MTSSGKKLPERSLGTLRDNSPTQVLSVRVLWPFRLLPVASHIWSASASMMPLATPSASVQMSSCRLIAPPSNLTCRDFRF